MKYKAIDTMPVHAGLKTVNFIFQRILRINGKCAWPVNFTSRVIDPGKIKIGAGVAHSFAVSGGCYIQALNGIKIGQGTIFGPGVKIVSADHELSDYSRWKKERPIIIGRHLWIGAGAIILPGVTLGDHIVVGAGAIVTKSFTGNQIIAGNPARVIKKLKR